MKKTFTVFPAVSMENIRGGYEENDYYWIPVDSEDGADCWVVVDDEDTIYTLSEHYAFITQEDAYKYAQRLAKQYKGVAAPWAD